VADLREQKLRAAKTFRRLAAQYGAWAKEGGAKAEHYAAEEKRLLKQAEFYQDWAERETENA
jgi:hypothetical protein